MIKVLKAALARLETAGDDWFSKLSKEQQRQYIKDHPNSKYAKQSGKGAKPASKNTDAKKPSKNDRDAFYFERLLDEKEDLENKKNPSSADKKRLKELDTLVEEEGKRLRKGMGKAKPAAKDSSVKSPAKPVKPRTDRNEKDAFYFERLLDEKEDLENKPKLTPADKKRLKELDTLVEEEGKKLKEGMGKDKSSKKVEDKDAWDGSKRLAASTKYRDRADKLKGQIEAIDKEISQIKRKAAKLEPQGKANAKDKIERLQKQQKDLEYRHSINKKYSILCASGEPSERKKFYETYKKFL